MIKIGFKKKFLIIIASFFLLAPAAMAAGILPAAENGRPGDNPCTSPNGCGNYSLDDMLQVAVNVANWILGVVGSVALLFFIYGGFTLIFSGGNETTVKKGKQILIDAVIGLVIVFTSFLIIRFSMQLLGAQTIDNTLHIKEGASAAAGLAPIAAIPAK